MSKTIKDLFIDELHDILSSEEQIVKALPKVAEAAESQELKDAYTSHLKETKEHVKRLEKVFKLLHFERKEKFCKATKGLIEECNEVIGEFHKSPVRDAALISKTQRIEHYEISAYGTVCTFAKELGYKEVAHILHDTLVEEDNADKKLTKIAEGGFLSTGINHKANISEKKLTPKKQTVKKPAVKALKASSTSKISPKKKVIKPSLGKTGTKALNSAKTSIKANLGRGMKAKRALSPR